MIGLDGRGCVVTGGAGGIGRATALRLAKEGARVLAVDLKAEGLAATAALGRQQGTPVETLVADITAAAAPVEILDHAFGKFGGLGVLVNNAGIGGARRAEDADDAEWDRFLDIDLRAVFRLSREAVVRMRPGGGAIVNIASIFGMVGFHAGGAAYAAAKAGVIGLTRQMAADYGPAGIRINAISPGLIETDLNRRRLATSAWFRGQMSEMIPLGRNGQPDDIAAAAAFLSSDDASFITGQVLVVDGGWLATRYRAGAEQN